MVSLREENNYDSIISLARVHFKELEDFKRDNIQLKKSLEDLREIMSLIESKEDQSYIQNQNNVDT